MTHTIELDAFVAGFVTAALWADCLPYDPRPRARELREEIESAYRLGRDPQRQLCELSDIAEYADAHDIDLDDPDAEIGETGGREWLTIDDESRELIADVCRSFIDANSDALAEYAELRTFDPSQGTLDAYLGHDFYLTAHGHGTGFWDRGTGEIGERLTAITGRDFGMLESVYLQDLGDGTAELDNPYLLTH